MHLNTEMKAAAHLIKGLGFETVRITTFDAAFNALIQAFQKKGNTKIDNHERFVAFVARYLPEEYRDRQDIIEAIYKSAKKEYEHLQTKN